MGWDRHKFLWDGTDKYVPWTTVALSHVHLYFVTRSMSESIVMLP